jgi:hypothetical protein
MKTRSRDLTDKNYRDGLSSAQVSIGLPFKIRALLKSRGKTAEWLARETGIKDCKGV